MLDPIVASPAARSRRPRLRRTHLLATAGVTAGLIAAFAPRAAHAQTTAPVGWMLERFEPTPAGETMFASEFPRYTGPLARWTVRAGLVADYAYRPLSLRSHGRAFVDPIVDHMLVGRLQVAAAFVDRIGVDLGLPVSLVQTADVPAQSLRTHGGLGPSPTVAAGDPRVGARVRLFGEADRDPISLHLGGALFLGRLLSQPLSNMTDAPVRVRLAATAAGRVGPVRYSASFGAHLRSEIGDVARVHVGHELLATLGATYVTAGGRLAVGPEVMLATTVSGGHAFQYQYLSAEALAGAHYRVGDAWQLGAAVGLGLAQGAGTPTARAIVSLAYAPELDARPSAPRAARAAPPAAAAAHAADRDRDRDGVLDTGDRCPDVPQGARPDPARAGCPLRGDRDRDGVLDELDRCLDVPAGLNPDPSRAGCPLADRDDDAVPDPPDRCPDEPGAPSTDPSRNGCPGLVRIDRDMLRVLAPVYFATDRDTILPRSGPVLEAVADALRATPGMRRLSVDGHTDAVATDSYNVDLAQRRANNVVRWLVTHGIDTSRLEAHGYGEQRPVDSNDTTDGRQANRRVEFRIVDPVAIAPRTPASGTATD